MKFYKQSATDSFAGNTSVGRFIFQETPSVDVETSEQTPKQKENFDAILANVLDELVSAKENNAEIDLREGEETIYLDGTSIKLDLRGSTTGSDAFTTDPEVGVLPTTARGGGRAKAKVIDDEAVKEAFGMTREELISRLKTEARALGERQDLSKEADTDADKDAVPAPIAPKGVEVSKSELEVALLNLKNKEAKGEEITFAEAEQIRLNWEKTDKTLVVKGAKVGEADVSTYDLFTKYVATLKSGAAPVVKPTPKPAAPVVNPDKISQAAEVDAEKAIAKLGTLTGKALQTEINAQAKALGITFPAGKYVENGLLVIDGDTKGTTDRARNKVIEALKAKLPIEGDNYISAVDELSSPSASDIIKAVKGNQVHARLLQKDLRNLGLYKGKIDGVLGGGSKGGLEAGLKKYGSVKALEAAARVAEVVKEGRRHGGKNPSVDALLTKIKAGEKITAADVVFTGKETGGSVDRTREILDFVEQASADKEISGKEAGKIIEMMMAEDKYNEGVPQKQVIDRTLYEGSGGFIIGLSRINPETRVREVSTKLASRIRGKASREQMAQDMLKSEKTLDLGTAQGNVEIDGRTFDIETLTKLYILTGQGQTAQGKGAVEMPIGDLTSSLKLHNLVYRDGALIGTMQNGCEGNLVVIPVDRQYVKYVKPKPPVVRKPVRQPRKPVKQPRKPVKPVRPVKPVKPVKPTKPDKPDVPTGGGTYSVVRCDADGKEYRYFYRRVAGWGPFNDQFLYKVPTGKSCNPGGDGDDDGGGDGKGGSGNSGRSDRRWKENITPIENALEKVSKINGVNYYWKDEHKAQMGDQLEIGVIAQDVQQVFPEAVITDENDELLVKYDKLVGALVEAVKELKAEVDELKKKNN